MWPQVGSGYCKTSSHISILTEAGDCTEEGSHLFVDKTLACQFIHPAAFFIPFIFIFFNPQNGEHISDPLCLLL